MKKLTGKMERLTRQAVSTSVALFAIAVSGCMPNTAPSVQPPGEDKTAKTRTLEAGAVVLQTDSPVDAMDVYLNGFHAMKNDPAHQMEAHHFCRQVNEDFAQCVIFDGSTQEANLTGVEYIISAKLFETLAVEERKYWHPHNYEILSGTLVAPGLPAVAEKELFKGKMNSYGKTWHFWSTEGRTAASKLPMGDPMLAWSFNRDGEAAPGLVERRDQRLGISAAQKRRERQELVNSARPQEGVDALKGRFKRDTSPVPGVVDKGSAG